MNKKSLAKVRENDVAEKFIEHPEIYEALEAMQRMSTANNSKAIELFTSTPTYYPIR